MCWNETVSLNTFLFSSFVLILIIYNNAFTKYKIQELNNKWMYIFIASFVFIQLIEFFIWRNINNKFYNNVFSTIAMCLLTLQPAASVMLLTNIQLRNLLLISYSFLAIPLSIYNFSTQHIHSVISESGHLRWKFVKFSDFIWVVWLFFFFFSFGYGVVFEKKWTMFLFGIITLLISFINYNQDNTVAGMWCWTINSMMIYYAIYLLIYLPFLEKMKIC